MSDTRIIDASAPSAGPHRPTSRAEAAGASGPTGVAGGTADPELAACARAYEALGDRLRAYEAEPPSDAERADLRAEIAALIRVADGQARAWRELAEAARALPGLWKQLPRAPGPQEPPLVAPSMPESPKSDLPEASASVAATARTDHLGASTFVAKGWSAYAIGDFAAAEAAFARALALAPDEPEALALHGWALAALGRGDDALLASHRVLARHARQPAASLARVAVGRVCLAKGIVGEALEHLARVTRDNDDRRATLYATFYLGVAYRRREMFDDAVAFFRRALALGPNLVEARYELGCACWEAGDHEAAREAWRVGAAAGNFSPWARRCEERLAPGPGRSEAVAP